MVKIGQKKASGQLLFQTLLYKAEKLSVCIFGTRITQQCLQRLKQDLHNVKAVPLMIRVYFYKPQEPTVHCQECVKDEAINHGQWF